MANGGEKWQVVTKKWQKETRVAENSSEKPEKGDALYKPRPLSQITSPPVKTENPQSDGQTYRVHERQSEDREPPELFRLLLDFVEPPALRKQRILKPFHPLLDLGELLVLVTHSSTVLSVA